MNSLYVILPSNTPVEGNRTSSFTIRLPNNLDLSEGAWTVALSSIIYPVSFHSDTVEEMHVIIEYYNDERGDKHYLRKENKIVIPNTVFKSVQHLEKTVNDAIANVVKKRAPSNEGGGGADAAKNRATRQTVRGGRPIQMPNLGIGAPIRAIDEEERRTTQRSIPRRPSSPRTPSQKKFNGSYLSPSITLHTPGEMLSQAVDIISSPSSSSSKPVPPKLSPEQAKGLNSAKS